MRIYTRTGDDGGTALFGGGRVPKDNDRVEAYGDVDELNASLGMARAVETMPRIDEVLVPVQRDLFAIGALLATPDHDRCSSSSPRRASTRTASRSSSAPSTRRRPS